jgi:lauroyl/myristoyl acyltransferase
MVSWATKLRSIALKYVQGVGLASSTHFCHQEAFLCIMATQQEKAFCVLRFAKLSSATSVQTSFRARYEKPLSSRMNIYRSYKMMMKLVTHIEGGM